MSDFFTIEDQDSVHKILVGHLGIPMHKDEWKVFNALQHDLLRYCTRLRCQPNINAHTDSQGYQVPQHDLFATTEDS